MTKDVINNGGKPVFPIIGTHEQVLDIGMTLRDYFAAKALQGVLACEMRGATEQEFAGRAYKIADAMLKAREKQ